MRDSNSRPSGPKPDALPDCANLRNALHPPAVIIAHQAPCHLSVKQHTITHAFHPLPDGDRCRIASASSVGLEPPVAATPLLILRVGVSVATRNVLVEMTGLEPATF